MIPTRKYQEPSPRLRSAAVGNVRKLAPHVSSRWWAICLVADMLAVHPNTSRSPVASSPSPVPSRRADEGRAQRERQLQSAAQPDLMRDLSNAVHTRREIDGAPV